LGKLIYIYGNIDRTEQLWQFGSIEVTYLSKAVFDILFPHYRHYIIDEWEQNSSYNIKKKRFGLHKLRHSSYILKHRLYIKLFKKNLIYVLSTGVLKSIIPKQMNKRGEGGDVGYMHLEGMSGFTSTLREILELKQRF